MGQHTPLRTYINVYAQNQQSNHYVTLPAPAYGVLLPVSDTNRTAELVSFLVDNRYFDIQTAVATIDMAVVNVMLERLVSIRFTVEFSAAGGALPFYKVMMSSPHVLPTDALDSFLTLVIVLFYIYFSWEAVKDIRELGWEIRKKRTMLLHHLNCVLYLVYWCVLFSALIYQPSGIKWGSDESFVYVKSFLELKRIANMLNACNAFLSWFKVSTLIVS